MHLNIEIKAHCPDPERVRQILKDHQAYFRGIDHQVDTYFKVPNGRLKLREGNIENHLIHYERPDQAGPKASHVSLFKTEPDSSLKLLLTKALGLLTIVDKKRSIYFIDNVKFHIDQVEELGAFVEIEAIDIDGNIGQAKLLEQCNHYIALLGIDQAQLLERSYSDLLIEKHKQ